MKIYTLTSSYGDNCSFIEDYPDGQDSIMLKAVNQKWTPFKEYAPIRLALRKSDAGKKNYKFDFSSSLTPFLVFSENAFSCLYNILKDRGQILPVITDSRRKKFEGYYPTNIIKKGCLDLDKSDYKIYPNGLMIYKPVLKKEKITDECLFCIEEDISRIYITEKFKEIIEKNKLVGFEFSEHNIVSLS